MSYLLRPNSNGFYTKKYLFLILYYFFPRITDLLKKKNCFVYYYIFCLKIQNATHALPTTKSELYIYASIVFFVVLWCRMRWQYRQFYRLADKIKGPPSYPLKGSIFDLSTTPESEYTAMQNQL